MGKLSERVLKVLILGGETNMVESEVTDRRAMYMFLKMADMLLTRLPIRHPSATLSDILPTIRSGGYHICFAKMACCRRS